MFAQGVCLIAAAGMLLLYVARRRKRKAVQSNPDVNA